MDSIQSSESAEKLKLSVVICGPSGIGKTSLTKVLCEVDTVDPPPFKFAKALSVTTRQQRPGETDGEDYNFITREKFDTMHTDGHFMETTTYDGEGYGSVVPTVTNFGADAVPVYVFDASGIEKLRNSCDRVFVVHMVPEPPGSFLSDRLTKRGDGPEKIARRVERMWLDVEQVERLEPDLRVRVGADGLKFVVDGSRSPVQNLTVVCSDEPQFYEYLKNVIVNTMLLSFFNLIKM